MVEVTDELRKRVVELRKAGVKYREIEKITGLNPAQIDRILKKAKERGELEMEEKKPEKVEVETQEASETSETKTETKTEVKKEFPPLELLNIKGYPPIEGEPKGEPMEPEEAVWYLGEDALREIKIRAVFRGLNNTPGVGNQSISALITRLRMSPYLLDDINNLFEVMKEFIPKVNVSLLNFICRDIAEIDRRYSPILNHKHTFLPQWIPQPQQDTQPQPIFYFPSPQRQPSQTNPTYPQPPMTQLQQQQPSQYQQWQTPQPHLQPQYWQQYPPYPYYPYPYPHPPSPPPSPQQDALQKLVERIEGLERKLEGKTEGEEKKKEDEVVERLKDEIKELRLRLAGNEEVRRLAEQLKEKERRIEQLEKEREQRQILDRVESVVQQHIASLKSEVASQISDLKSSIPKNLSPEQFLELRKIGVEEATKLRELDLREQELKAELERKKSFSEKVASFLDSFGDKIANAVAATVTEEESGEKYETPAGTLQNQPGLMMMQCPSCGAPVVFPSIAKEISCPKCGKVFINPSFEDLQLGAVSEPAPTPMTTPTTTPTTPMTTMPEAPAPAAEETEKAGEVEVAKEEGSAEELSGVEETKADAGGKEVEVEEERTAKGASEGESPRRRRGKK